ncbi:MAG: tyrosine-type recombinase/integrase [Chloroflexi bacterium]|nr:tyrosine-type recombinase/integrase [Chloroflexota bacterium]
MVSSPPDPVSIAPRGDLRPNAASFGRHLRASNLSPRTVQTYLESVDRFATFLEDRGMPTDVAGIRREHVEAFMESLLERFKPTTATNRYSGLQAFFKWAVDEGEIRDSPMARTRKPRLPEHAPPVLSEDQLRAILAACEGQGFDERRDTALVRVFIGSGARLAEVTALRWVPDDPEQNDLDLDLGVIRIRSGKGRRERATYIGTKAIRALDRYIRVRGKHRHAALSALWVGQRGAMTESGIAQMLRDRGAAAGVPGLHAHQFRHSYASRMLAAGFQETDLMQLAGWRSREMLARYAAATRSERAIAAARRLNPGDEL